MEAFELNAEQRTSTGRGENRRMRRQGQVPAVIYGGKGEPSMISLNHNELANHLDNEAFYSHVVKIKVNGGQDEEAILRDLQRHPAKPFIQHADFLRVVADEKFRTFVPVRLVNEESCVGVKEDGGIIELTLTEVEIECLPRDLPQNITVDIAELKAGESYHLSDLNVPEGVALVDLLVAEEGDVQRTVVSVHMPRAAVEEDDEAAEEAGSADSEQAEE